MARNAADFTGLEQTLPLYGDVFRAQAVFQGLVFAYLAERFDAYRERLEAAGMRFADQASEPKLEANDWAFYCYRSFPLAKLAALKDASDTSLRLYIGWRAAPESDAQALPFAYVELHYRWASDRDAWKSHMARVKEALPEGLEVQHYKDYFGLSFRWNADTTYRPTLSELTTDFGRLAEGLAAALTKASAKVTRAG